MKKKILIVEDEGMLGEMYYDKFTQAGFQAVLAKTAEEGIKLVSEIKPDLILLDILLPRLNGINFMEWFKKENNVSLPPIIAFSNYDDPETKKQASLLGAKEYLIKTNHTPQEIIDKVNFHLNN
jgi:DNA-binding response OmpR family regulator